MIYLVMGETGEYSDWRCWVVRAFHGRGDAESTAADLNGWVRRVKEAGFDACYDGPEGHWLTEDMDFKPLPDSLRPIPDPNFKTSYTGTSYAVLEVPADMDPLPAGYTGEVQ